MTSRVQDLARIQPRLAKKDRMTRKKKQPEQDS
jgi:hypothetical protein